MASKTYTVTIPDIGAPEVHDEHGAPLTDVQIELLLRQLETHKRAWIYLAYGYVSNLRRRCYKIGLSADPGVRLGRLGLTQIHLIPCMYQSRQHIERIVHWFYIDRMRWITREYFDLTKEDVDIFKRCQSSQDVYSWGVTLHLMNLRFDEIQGIYDEMRQTGHQTITSFFSDRFIATLASMRSD